MKKPITLAVLGDPIAHSKSPSIHQAFANQWGQAVDYQAIHCPLDALPSTLDRLYQEGFQGANLTVPLKEQALALCEQLEPAGRMAQAINTVVRTPTGWLGTNTDGQGLVNDLNDLHVVLKNKRVLLIGAGGAAAGVCGPILEAGVARLAILNRTEARAHALCDHLNDSRVSVLSLEQEQQPSDPSAFDLIIQATSAGHGGEIMTPPSNWMDENTVAYDLNYGPAHAVFFQWAKAQGLMVFDGLGMLVWQAALSFERWTGFQPDVRPVLAALKENDLKNQYSGLDFGRH